MIKIQGYKMKIITSFLMDIAALTTSAIFITAAWNFAIYSWFNVDQINILHVALAIIGVRATRNAIIAKDPFEYLP